MAAVLFVISLYLPINTEIHLLCGHFPHQLSKTYSTCQCSQGKSGKRTARPPKTSSNRRFVWRNGEQVQDNSHVHSSTFQFILLYYYFTAKPYLCCFHSHPFPVFLGTLILFLPCPTLTSPCCSAVCFSFQCTFQFYWWWKLVHVFGAGPFEMLMDMGTFFFKQQGRLPNFVHCCDLNYYFFLLFDLEQIQQMLQSK